MDNPMDGAVAVEEQHLWMTTQFVGILAKSKEIGIKIDEMQERILGLKKEQQKLLNRHEKILEASNLLEILCQAFQSANTMLREGNISSLKTEWEKLKTISGAQDDCPVTMLIERIRKISIESGVNKELPQCAGSVSQQGDYVFEKKKMLSAELELCVQFSPALLVLEDDLINQNKLLRLERNQLEEKVKRTLATFARIKLDLSRYEDECHRLQNILQKSSNALWVPNKVEINKMSADIKEIEKKNSVMLCQWQGHHNVLCGILDDVRIFNTHAVKGSENIWHLCRSCKTLNSERLELIYQLLGINTQGHN